MKSKYQQHFILAAIVVAALLALRFSGVLNYFTIDTIKMYSAELQHFVENRYILAVISYIGTYIIVAGLAVPLAAFLSIVGGFMFGTLLGAVYANIGATVGATISFFASRYLIGRWVQERYAERLVKFNKFFEEEGTSYLLSVHLVAVVPFFLINTLAGLTKVSTWTFIWTTAVGIIPGSLVFTFAGSQLHTIDKISDIVSGPILLAFGLLALLALMPTIIMRYKNWRSRLLCD